MTPTLVRDDMRYWRMQPDERLRPRVICYFLVEPTGQTPPGERVPPERQQQLLLPDGYSEIVFNLDAAFERWAIGQPEQRAVMSSSYLIGGRSHSVLTCNRGAVRLAGAKLDSRLLRAIIGMPLSEFRDSTLTLSEVGARPLLDLDESIHSARRPTDSRAHVEAGAIWRNGRCGRRNSTREGAGPKAAGAMDGVAQVESTETAHQIRR
jgi:hypothetical protein